MTRLWNAGAVGMTLLALLALPVTDARAQSFEQLTRDGQAAMRNGDWARALELRFRQLSMKPPNPEDHCFVYWGLYTAYTLGSGEMAKGLKAVDDSLQCLNDIPSNSVDMLEYREEALRYRVMTLRDWGRYDEALAAVDAMDKLRPDRAVAHESTRAIVLEAKGGYEAAAASYARASAKDSFWLNYSAWMRVKQGNPDRALTDLAAASAVAPYVPGKTSNTRAWILVEQGQYDAAIAEIKSDERANSANAAAHAYLRGYIEAANGNFSAAAAAMRPALAVNGSNATVLVAAYLAQARAGQNNRADLAAKARQFDANKWPDAQVAFVTGDIDRRTFAAAASFGNPRIERARLCRMNFVAGEVAIIKGDIETAKADLNRAVELCPLDPAAQERTWAKGDLVRLASLPAISTASPPPPAVESGDCAAATAHWTSTESIATRAAYQDHLTRFPNCPFATLAAARIAALDRGVTPAGKSGSAANCPPGTSRDSDGDCARSKAAAKPVRRRAPSEDVTERSGGRDHTPLDCTTPAGLMACANRALTNLSNDK